MEHKLATSANNILRILLFSFYFIIFNCGHKSTNKRGIYQKNHYFKEKKIHFSLAKRISEVSKITFLRQKQTPTDT
jgi:hypothetical protein